MLVQMDETRIQRLADIAVFLTNPLAMPLVLQGDKDEGYSWIERTLVCFRYTFGWARRKRLGAALC